MKKAVDDCPAVDHEGLPCRKKLHHAQNGEYWDHAGGHFFASAEALRTFNEKHYDAGALLAGLPVVPHDAADCPGTGACAWR